jgi:hypothetical protein
VVLFLEAMGFFRESNWIMGIFPDKLNSHLFYQPVLDQKDRRVTALDLKKDRQMAICRKLLKQNYSVYGFKTADLKLSLHEYFSNSAQIRYEIFKLICLGAILKQKKIILYGYVIRLEIALDFNLPKALF